MKKSRIAIIGSTGSIGTQALDLVRRHADRLEVVALAANSSAQALCRQVEEFKPKAAVLASPPEGFVPPPSQTEWGFGLAARDALCAMSDVDAVLVCVVGMTGISAVLESIKYHKRILLANKETLMCAGNLIMRRAKEAGVTIMPVDSEHTAIWQCLRGEKRAAVSQILLTASGGPFRTWDQEAIDRATVQQALKHPNWTMGKKISVDSASMMNKSIEIVEAHHIFSMPPEKITVYVHPQSIVHSAVAYRDGSVIAHMSVADMRVPILYALLDGERADSGVRPLNLFEIGTLTFEPCNEKKFPVVRAAYEALKLGGNACTVMNAVNEVAVEAFLNERIRFGKITQMILSALDTLYNPSVKTYEQIMEADRYARVYARNMINGSEV